MIPSFTNNCILLCDWLIDHGYTTPERIWNSNSKPTIVDKGTIDLLVRESVLKEVSPGHYYVKSEEFESWVAVRIKRQKRERRVVKTILIVSTLLFGLFVILSISEYFF